MINTSIESSQIKIENLYKSIFSDTPNTNFIFKSDYVCIIHIDTSNSDPATIEIIEQEEHYKVSYWDGYSLAEVVYEKDLVIVPCSFSHVHCFRKVAVSTCFTCFYS